MAAAAGVGVGTAVFALALLAPRAAAVVVAVVVAVVEVAVQPTRAPSCGSADDGRKRPKIDLAIAAKNVCRPASVPNVRRMHAYAGEMSTSDATRYLRVSKRRRTAVILNAMNVE